MASVATAACSASAATCFSMPRNERTPKDGDDGGGDDDDNNKSTHTHTEGESNGSEFKKKVGDAV